MGGAPPSFFEEVRADAERTWVRREVEDPEAAGAVRQLFEQVQDPHHVISELLGNADDDRTAVLVEFRGG